jgi:RHS repeat-associated protein
MSVNVIEVLVLFLLLSGTISRQDFFSWQALSTWNSLRIVVTAGQITAYWNNTQSVSWTDPSPLANGKVGFRKTNGSIVNWDNFYVLSNDIATVVSYEDYYPFGLTMPNRSMVNVDPTFRFTGKEKSGSIGRYLFGARTYNPLIGRWDQVDPMADKYPGLSPYNYCANNPINIIDPKGDTLWVKWQTGWLSFLGWGQDHKAYYQDGKLYENGQEYTGDNSFAIAVRDALTNIDYGGMDGCLLVNSLVYSEINYKILESSGINEYKQSGHRIFWNTSIETSGINENGSIERPNYIGLAHEMGHAWDHDYYSYFGVGWKLETLWYTTAGGEDIHQTEMVASNIENMIRVEHNLPRRKFYSLIKQGNGKYKGEGPIY